MINYSNFDNVLCVYIKGSVHTTMHIDEDQDVAKQIDFAKSHYCRSIPDSDIIVDRYKVIGPMINQAINSKYLTGMQEITEARYNDMLNVLPPHRWTRKNGAESFICPEPIMSGIHDYFVKLKGRYFVKPCKIRNVTHEQLVTEAFGLIQAI